MLSSILILLVRDLTEHVGMMMMGVSPRFLQKRQMSNEVLHYALVYTTYPKIYTRHCQNMKGKMTGTTDSLEK